MSHKIKTLSGYIHEYQKSVLYPEEFWGGIAESFHWKKAWDQTLQWDFEGPNVNWFANGKLNITENILERHLFTQGDQPAIIWEPNDPKEANIILTYRELYEKTCQFSNAMEAQGIKKGDRVIIYMPMVPEAAIAMLACARVGAVHSVVFAGFSSSSLADRINDCEAKMVVTSDGNFRGAKNIPVKAVVDEALESCTTVDSVIVLKRTNT
ncbi:MAG: AMP-binding protein, partial [Cyclobacteriaceae bacterium]